MKNQQKFELYSVRENWEVLKLFLHDKEAQQVLNENMSEFCEIYNREWVVGTPPWTETTSDYWHTEIENSLEEDEEYQQEIKELEEKWLENGELLEELWECEEYQEELEKLYEKHTLKHEPKVDSMEWYQLKHGCHWINPFLAMLISKALNVEAFVWSTRTHTVVEFMLDGKFYYADILNDWNSVAELLDFMGDDTVAYYPIN